MTRIKLCGLSRIDDIEAVNRILPDYIGFVFAKKSKRYVSKEKAAELKRRLDERIRAVGVFVNEDYMTVAEYLSEGLIDIAQLHGNEDDDYIDMLRRFSGKPVIKAFRISGKDDLLTATESTADYILLDAGTGDGIAFDWSILRDMKRPFFLAGGLDTENVKDAVEMLSPFAVDVSSGIETEGVKDPEKMKAFTDIVRSVTHNG
ncbi:MAG: phosphoribosylanthranilate isomerase [Lachnospiraceae bacterium]|nr:phosphoribosylanthranilate isomerase [Lachnospiraceae bacterium]